MTPREGEPFFSSAMTLYPGRARAAAKSQAGAAFCAASFNATSGSTRLRCAIDSRRAATILSRTVFPPELVSMWKSRTYGRLSLPSIVPEGLAPIIHREKDARLIAVCGRAGEQGIREADGNTEIRAAEALEDRVGDADHLALIVEQRAAGPARRRLGVENDLVRQNISD